MRHSVFSSLILAGLAGLGAFPGLSAEFQFKHHFITRELPINERSVGDYGLTALVDLDGDGDLDFVLGGRPSQPSQLYWFEYQGPDQWTQHLVGTNFLSDVGLAALDVDGDGWPDLICSGVWYRNPGKPRTQLFERLVFDANAAGAHDILIADIDGDRKPDVVMMGDERTKLNALCWYSIPKDPKQPWLRHPIG
ncbi:MAG TPA: VCBS repeat-containing protein, partial [Candidatus Saccharimonadales bacterium]|nr:VCBS repeat-containing protein [Candidatus Saccharimonadales bacterium]